MQTDEQTEIDMETNIDVDIEDKSVYIRAFRPREDSQSTSLRSIQSNNFFLRRTSLTLCCGITPELVPHSHW